MNSFDTKSANSSSHMTFKQVKEYLNPNKNAAGSLQQNDIGSMTLSSLRGKFQDSEPEMERLRMEVKRKREIEKADEVRLLKIKQQKYRMQKNQEEREIQELIEEIEKRKESELRARVEKERIKKELRDLDLEKLSLAESSRKKQLANINKEKEILTAKEQETIKEIEEIKQNVKTQELEFRKKQVSLEESLKDNNDEKDIDRHSSLRKAHMQRSLERGEKVAALSSQKADILQRINHVEVNMKNINAGRRSNKENVQQGHDDSLSAIISKISITDQEEKLKAMKSEMKVVRDQQVAFMNSQEQLGIKCNEENKHGDETAKFLENWMTNDQSGISKHQKSQIALKEITKFQTSENESKSCQSSSPENSSTVCQSNQPPKVKFNDALSDLENNFSQKEIDKSSKHVKTFISDGNPSPRVKPTKTNVKSNQPTNQDIREAPNDNYANTYGRKENCTWNQGNRQGASKMDYDPKHYNKDYNGWKDRNGNSWVENHHHPNLQRNSSNSFEKFNQVHSNPYGSFKGHTRNSSPEECNERDQFRNNRVFQDGPTMFHQPQYPYYGQHMYAGHAMYDTPYHYPHPIQQPQFGHMYQNNLAAAGAASMGVPYVPSLHKSHPYIDPTVPYSSFGMSQSTAENAMIMQQLRQQEIENERLKYHTSRTTEHFKEEQDLDLENHKLDKIFGSIHSKLERLNPYQDRVKTNENVCEVKENKDQSDPNSDSKMSFEKNDLHYYEQLNTLPENSQIRALKVKHFEEMTRLRNERDRMEEEKKLEEIRITYNRRKKEMEKEAEHEEWMAQQKRQLLALRMRKVLAKELPHTQSISNSNSSIYHYNPEVGFAIFWDYILDIPVQTEKIQLTYALYEKAIQRSRHFSVRPRECEPHLVNSRRCIFAAKKSMKKISASLELQIIIEICSVLRTSNVAKPKLVTIGWASMDIFHVSPSGDICLQNGMIKLLVHPGPVPDLSKEIPPSTVDNSASIFLFIRVLHEGEESTNASQVSIDPEITAGSYRCLHSQGKVDTGNSAQQRNSSNSKKRKDLGTENSRQYQTKTEEPIKIDNMDTRSNQSYSRNEIVDVGGVNVIYLSLLGIEFNSSSPKISSLIQISTSVVSKDLIGNDPQIQSIYEEVNPIWTSGLLNINSLHTLNKEIELPTPKKEDSVVLIVVLTNTDQGTNLNICFWAWVELPGDEALKRVNGQQQSSNLFDIETSPSSIKILDKNCIGQLSFKISNTPDITQALNDDNQSTCSTSNLEENNDRPDSRMSILSKFSKTSNRLSNIREAVPDDAAWLEMDPKYTVNYNLLFEGGDGFDVYVDGARFLPDNVSITKLTVKAFTADMAHVDPEEIVEMKNNFYDDTYVCYASFQSDCFSPLFNKQFEFRSDRFNPTLTLVFRLDTIDSKTKDPVVLGYSTLAVFLDEGTKEQVKKTNTQDFLLNYGHFQLPIHTNLTVGDGNAVEFNENSCSSHRKLPCASILVRIATAQKSVDGLKVLSRSLVPKSEWISKKIVQPSQPYSTRVYNSTKCIPDKMEKKLFSLRQKRNSWLVEDAVKDVSEKNSTDETQIYSWLETNLAEKPSKLIELNRIATYQPEIGFRISIDGLHNVTNSKKSYFKVLYSLFPPAHFYQDPKLAESVQFTTSLDWNSSHTSPEFQDGFYTYRDVPDDPNLLVLLDVRIINRNPKTGKIVSQPFGWAVLPVLSKFNCVEAGSYQLPLLQNVITASLLEHDLTVPELIESETLKKKGLISYLNGASMLVRLEDCQVPNLFPSPRVDLSDKYIPVKTKAKYVYDEKKIAAQKKKMTFQKFISAKEAEKTIEKEINIAFAKEMDITHYTFD